VRVRVRAGLATTPGRLSLHLTTIVVLGLLAGVVAVAGVVARAGEVDQVAHGSGPLAVQAQQLYRSLSDADATEAAAFLTSGSEPPALRSRYLNDIAAAGQALAASVASDAARAQVTEVATALPTYTALVETARADNHAGLPVGAAYLREASALMRGTLLPAAQQLYLDATSRLASDRASGAGFPWLSVALVLLTLAALGSTQRYLTRRTRRLVNRGLAGASLAAALLLVWVLGSWASVAIDLHRSDVDGSAQVQAIAQARILTLQARADEALTLVARGSGAAFEADYAATMKQLTEDGGALGLAGTRAGDDQVRALLADAVHQVSTWQAEHAAARRADNAGDYPAAVAITVTDQTKASATFAQLDHDLQQAIAITSQAFDAAAGDAGGGLGFAAVVWALLAAVVVGTAVFGVQQRLAEYR
jgi:hypothetical protein